MMQRLLSIILLVVIAMPVFSAQEQSKTLHKKPASSSPQARTKRRDALWKAIEDFDIDKVEFVAKKMSIKSLKLFVLDYFNRPMDDLQRDVFLSLRFDDRWSHLKDQAVHQLLIDEAVRVEKEKASKLINEDPFWATPAGQELIKQGYNTREKRAVYSREVNAIGDSLRPIFAGKTEEEGLKIIEKAIEDSFKD